MFVVFAFILFLVLVYLGWKWAIANNHRAWAWRAAQVLAGIYLFLDVLEGRWIWACMNALAFCVFQMAYLRDGQLDEQLRNKTKEEIDG